MNPRKLVRAYGLPCLAVGMFLFSVYHLLFAAERVPLQTPVGTPPAAPFRENIAASGIVESRRENVAVSAAVSGVVLEVCVNADQVGQSVTRGTPLFRVDDRHWQAQRQVQLATLEAAQAELDRLAQMPRPEEIPVSEAKVRAAEAERIRAEDLAQRMKQMVAQRAIPESEWVAAHSAFQRADQLWTQARAEDQLLKAGAWHEDRRVAQAAVDVARANLHRLDTEIERCLVRAPIDGQVLKIDVRPGEYIAANPGQTGILLGDLSRTHVRVAIDEHDISRFVPHSTAVAEIRGAASQRLPLRFVRVEPHVIPKRSFTGNSTERLDTRVLEVIYEIDAAQPGVFVGQQVDVFIEVAGDR